MHFTRQLAVFVKAGIPITEALADHRRRDRRTSPCSAPSRRWSTTSATAARCRTPRRKHPEAFPNYYIGILQSAELTGKLDETLESLAGYLERELETRSKVVSALSYPGVVMVLAMFTVVDPRRLRAAAVQAAVRGARRRPAVADADAAVRRHAVQHVCGTSRSASSACSAASCTGCSRPRPATGEGQAGAADPGHQGHRRVRDPRAVLPHPGARWSRPACRCPTAMKTTTEATTNIVFRERLEIAQARCSRVAASPSRWPRPSCSPAPPSRCSRSARRPERSTSSSRWPASTSTASSRAGSRSSPPCSSRS